MTSLRGRRVLVTGAGGTIGRAVAIELAARGANLIVAGRTEAALAETLDAVVPGDHALITLDVGDEASWTPHRAQVAAATDVVCTAAVLTPVGEIGTYAPKDFWHTMQINVLGSLLAVHHALDGLKAARGAVVMFSGGGATKPHPRYDAYATSKAATVRLAENLSVSLADDGIRVNTVAPGFVASAMHEATLNAGPEAAGTDSFDDTRRNLERGGVPPERSAALVARLLGDEAQTVTGRLISAEWDPWETTEYFAELAASPDLGTLRRVDNMFVTAIPQEQA